MARDIPDWYLDALAAGPTLSTRIVLLDDMRQPLIQITGDDGEGIAFAGGFAARRIGNPSRTADLSVVNDHGAWTPTSLASEFSIGRYATVERVVSYAGNEASFQLMIGQITDPSIEVTPTDDFMGLKLVDLWRVLQKKRFQSMLVKQRGMRLREWVRIAAVAAGWPDDDSQFDLDDGGAAFTEDQPVELYGLIADDLEQSAEAFGCWIRVGYDGTLLLSVLPTVDDQGTSIRSYSPGETSTLMRLGKQLTDAGFYNHTRVTGQSLRSGVVVEAEWRDLNPLSPSYNPPAGIDPQYLGGGGPLGDRMMEPYSSSLILTYEAALAKAKQLGFAAATLQETHNISAIADASLEPGDVITLGVEEADAVGDLLLNDVQMGLADGGEGDSDLFQVDGQRQRQLVAS